MRKYDTYKDSGVEWIGEIPGHWKISRLRNVGTLYGGLSGKSGDDFRQEDHPNNKPYIPYTNIFNNTYISRDHYHYVVVNDGESQNRVHKFDLFFLMSSETHQDLGKSCILIEDVEELYLNSFCKGLRVIDTQVYPLFLNYQLLGYTHKELISVEGRGFTRINLRQDRLKGVPIFIPPLPEQEAIVTYLDRKTSQIDTLIELKTRKIELLREKRTALINHVVTKGLDPDVEMKDSGVEWIGEIPAHWEVTRVKFISKIYGRIGYRGYTTEDIVSEGEGVITISPSNIFNDQFTLKSATFLKWDKYYESPEIMIFPEDIIIVKTGSTIGKTAIIPEGTEEMTINPQLIVLKDIKLINRFLFYQTTCLFIKESFLIEQTGSSTPTISQEKINQFPILLSSIVEQKDIVAFLDDKTTEIDNLIDLEQTKVDQLQEYRQSLISNVVTGKIRVCEEDHSNAVTA